MKVAAVLPGAAHVGPLLAIGPEPLQAEAVAGLVELAEREHGASGGDRPTFLRALGDCFPRSLGRRGNSRRSRRPADA